MHAVSLEGLIAYRMDVKQLFFRDHLTWRSLRVCRLLLPSQVHLVHYKTAYYSDLSLYQLQTVFRVFLAKGVSETLRYSTNGYIYYSETSRPQWISFRQNFHVTRWRKLFLMHRNNRDKTNVYSNLARGRIAVLSLIAAEHGFIRSWLHLIHGSLPILGHTWVSSQTTSRSVQPFWHSSSVCLTYTQTHTDTQTALHATSIAIGRISSTACKRCGLVIIIIIISGQKILMKGRIAGYGGIFTLDSVMWHRRLGSIAVLCSSGAVMPLCIFLQRTTQQWLTHNAFCWWCRDA